MALPIFQTLIPDLQLLQTRWASELNPVLSFPPIQGNLLNNIALANGETVINHKLGRKLQGWIIVDVDAGTTIYRSAPLNDKTLSLTSGAACTASLWVY